MKRLLYVLLLLLIQTAANAQINNKNSQSQIKNQRNNNNSLSVFLITDPFNCQNYIDVTLSARGFKEIISMQGGVKWDTAYLFFDTIIKYGSSDLLLNSSNFGTTTTKDGALSFSWNDLSLSGVTLADSSILFTIRLKLKFFNRFQTSIVFGSDPILTEFVNQSFEELPVKNDTLSVEFEPGKFDFNPFPDTLRLCGNAILDAGELFENYLWNTGSRERKIQVTASGKYSVEVTGNLGCKASDTVYVILLPKPEININDTAVCKGASIRLTSNTNTFGLSRFWILNDNIISRDETFVRSFNTLGTFNVKFLLTSGSCRDSVIRTINVVDLPKAEINFKDTTICKGQPLKIRQLNELNSLSREWSINNSVVSAEKEFDASFTEIGTSLIKLVVIGEASCRDSAFAKVSTFSAPRSVIKVNNALQCLNNNLFNFRSEDTLLRLNLLYSWNLGDSTFAQTPTVIHKYEKPGIYNVALVLITEKGCRDTAAIDVIVEPEINSVRYETKNLIVNTTVPLEARNFQGATYSWSPKFQLSNYNERKTNFNGADPVEYLIDIKTPAGCKATDTLPILIFQEDDVFVPDVFTPNNDGQNDYFFPFYTRNIKLEYFKIFNRWGNLIYNSSSPKPGWDGTYNGLAQPIGAYVWVLEAVDLAGKKIRKKGNFMLLK